MHNVRFANSILKAMFFKDPWPQVHSSPKMVPEVDSVVKKAFGTLAFIGQRTEYRIFGGCVTTVEVIVCPQCL